MLESLILRYGYFAVGVGTFFEGETILIAAGALAHRGLLSLPFVVLAAFIGGTAGDQMWFHVGERFGRRYIERRPALRDRADRVERWFARYGDAFVIGFRFVYGIRVVTPVLLGASHFSTRRFAFLNMIGAGIWAATFGILGWALGASFSAILARAGRIEELVVAAVGLGAALWVAQRVLRKRPPPDGHAPSGGNPPDSPSD
ncbi:DedA family protein [Labilithrix luteola]|uniref:DedA family protein n=1 Tax=Labilithrix luteola TaxID=1391654 RepID=A0A0K1QGD5_9BACT|nr:DedA family protein [Labilithrix luteola]